MIRQRIVTPPAPTYYLSMVVIGENDTYTYVVELNASYRAWMCRCSVTAFKADQDQQGLISLEYREDCGELFEGDLRENPTDKNHWFASECPELGVAVNHEGIYLKVNAYDATAYWEVWPGYAGVLQTSTVPLWEIWKKSGSSQPFYEHGIW